MKPMHKCEGMDSHHEIYVRVMSNNNNKTEVDWFVMLVTKPSEQNWIKLSNFTHCPWCNINLTKEYYGFLEEWYS